MLSVAGIGNELGLSGKIIDFAGPIQMIRYSLEKEHSLFQMIIFQCSAHVCAFVQAIMVS